MKRVTRTMVIVFFVLMCLFTTVFATGSNATTDNSKDTSYAVSSDSSQGTLKSERTSKILELKKHEEATIEGYKEKYGSDVYGVTAYILDRVRIYSIPLVFIGLAFTGMYQYIVGLKKLDVRDKGFYGMIAIITIGVICQILPIVFAIVVTSTGNQ